MAKKSPIVKRRSQSANTVSPSVVAAVMAPGIAAGPLARAASADAVSDDPKHLAEPVLLGRLRPDGSRSPTIPPRRRRPASTHRSPASPLRWSVGSDGDGDLVLQPPSQTPSPSTSPRPPTQAGAPPPSQPARVDADADERAAGVASSPPPSLPIATDVERGATLTARLWSPPPRAAPRMPPPRSGSATATIQEGIPSDAVGAVPLSSSPPKEKRRRATAVFRQSLTQVRLLGHTSGPCRAPSPSQIYAAPHAPCNVLYQLPVLMRCGWVRNPAACPIHPFRRCRTALKRTATRAGRCRPGIGA